MIIQPCPGCAATNQVQLERIAALEAENNDIRAVNLQLLDETRELVMLNSNQRAMLEGKHAYVGQDFQFRIDTQSKRIRQLERELAEARKDAERLRAIIPEAIPPQWGVIYGHYHAGWNDCVNRMHAGWNDCVNRMRKALAKFGGVASDMTEVDITKAMHAARKRADTELRLSYPATMADLERMMLWSRVYENELRAMMGWEPMP